MKLRKGLLRILVLGLCFFLCIKFAMEMLYLFGPSVTFDSVFGCLMMFEIAFSIPVTFILLANFVKPEAERFFDIDSLPTKMVFAGSIVTGFVCLAIYSLIRPTGPHVGAYFMAIMIPFMLIFGSYVSALWIAEGFRKSV